MRLGVLDDFEAPSHEIDTQCVSLLKLRKTIVIYIVAAMRWSIRFRPLRHSSSRSVESTIHTTRRPPGGGLHSLRACDDPAVLPAHRTHQLIPPRRSRHAHDRIPRLHTTSISYPTHTLCPPLART
jgi:hypothetical protein